MNTKDLWDALKELSDKQFKIYSAIHKLADNEIGYCFASDTTIGEKIGKHRKNVNAGVGELIKLGYLTVLKIEEGTRCTERRLYPTFSYKIYLEDKERQIIPTTYKVEEDKTVTYFNERNTSNKTVAGKLTSNDSVAGTGNGSVAGTSNDSVTEKVSNINTSKIKDIYSIDQPPARVENFDFLYSSWLTVTTQHNLKKLWKEFPDVAPTKEIFEAFLVMCKAERKGDGYVYNHYKDKVHKSKLGAIKGEGGTSLGTRTGIKYLVNHHLERYKALITKTPVEDFLGETEGKYSIELIEEYKGKLEEAIFYNPQ